MSDFDDNADFVDDPVFSKKPWVGIGVPLIVVAIIAFSVLVFIIRRRRMRRRRNGLSLNQQGRLALERDFLEEGYGGGDGAGAAGADSSSNRRRMWHGYNVNARFSPASDLFGGRHEPLTILAESAYLPPGGRSASASAARSDAADRRTRRQQPRTANRWAWANSINLATLGGGGSSGGVVRIEEGLNELGEAPPPYEGRKTLPKVTEEEDEEAHEAAAAGGSPRPVSVVAPTAAHLRGSIPDPRTSLDGETIAGTITTTITTTTTGSQSRTVSSSSTLEQVSIPTSPTLSAPALVSTPASTAPPAPAAPTASPRPAPPAYSERPSQPPDRPTCEGDERI